MNLKEKIEEICRETQHGQFAVTTTSSVETAKAFTSKLRSSLCEAHVINVTTTKPKTEVEKLKIGKLVSEDEAGKRHKATCEVIITTETETIFYVVILLSNRDVKRRVEKLAGTQLRWESVGVVGVDVQPSATDEQSTQEVHGV